MLGETEADANQAALGCRSAEALEQWRRRDALYWQETLDEEAFSGRFDVGHGHAYGCIEQMLSCTDYALLFELFAELSPPAT